MFKAVVKGSEAAYPWRSFDSVLEIPNGDNANQNAWLTLQLRIKLNFCDSKNAAGVKTENVAGKWYARDYNDYLFPMLDWTPDLIDRFMKGFVKRAQDTWNYQFVLVTPRNYAGIDYDAAWRTSAPLKVRPNVICLIRLALIGPNGLLDNSPAAGPLRAGPPTKTINVFNLDWSTRLVKRAAGAKPDPDFPNQRSFSAFADSSFRSDDSDYDDADLYLQHVVDGANKVEHNTIGHEVGHALGQAHIRGLEGDPTCAIDAPHNGDSRCYGADMQRWNIMGDGNRIFMVNAVSWKERIALHTGLPSGQWAATGIMATPPRSLPSAIVDLGLAPPLW